MYIFVLSLFIVGSYHWYTGTYFYLTVMYKIYKSSQNVIVLI